jgi:hypothetical protein
MLHSFQQYIGVVIVQKFVAIENYVFATSEKIGWNV